MNRTSLGIGLLSRHEWLVLAIFCNLTGSAKAQENNPLNWVESGISDKVRGFRPMSLTLTKVAPETIKRAPLGLTVPLYAVFKIGPAEASATIVVLSDIVRDKPKRLFVDSNANGDLTDDPINMWTEKRTLRPDGKAVLTYNNSAWVSIPFASGPRKGYLKFYTVASASPQETMYYYSDYGVAGTLKLGNRTVSAVLQDAGCTGDFHLTPQATRAPLLWLELDKRFKAFPVTRPFELDNQWWEVVNIAPGGSFKIAVVAKPEESRSQSETDLSPGRLVPAFSAQLTSGAKVEFPGQYKGKIVLLDFWATWCGPCVAEIPNLVQAYEKFHNRGFEVLGVSLDRENWEAKLAAFTKEHKMPWPQIYDGKYAEAKVARFFDIQSIPHMILVDGDTGNILANKDIRGELLAPAIEKALTAKQR